jgi:hypothetical protein
MSRLQLLTPPEVERRVLFERGGDEDELAANQVGRHPPLDVFLNLREHRVNAVADVA